MPRKESKESNVVSILSKKYNNPVIEIPSTPLRNSISENIASAQIDDDSLCEKGILKGDYLVFDLDAKVEDGDMALVDFSGDMAIRIVRYTGDGMVRLESADLVHKPIFLKLREVKIIGRVIRSERDW